MGSVSDYEVMSKAVSTLGRSAWISRNGWSAPTTPDLLCEYAKTARERGIRRDHRRAGGAAHLPGMVAPR